MRVKSRATDFQTAHPSIPHHRPPLHFRPNSFHTLHIHQRRNAGLQHKPHHFRLFHRQLAESQQHAIQRHSLQNSLRPARPTSEASSDTVSGSPIRGFSHSSNNQRHGSGSSGIVSFRITFGRLRAAHEPCRDCWGQRKQNKREQLPCENLRNSLALSFCFSALDIGTGPAAAKP